MSRSLMSVLAYVLCILAYVFLHMNLESACLVLNFKNSYCYIDWDQVKLTD